MASYLWNLLSATGLVSAATAPAPESVPDVTIQITAPDPDDDDGELTEREEHDDDKVPVFPALNSPQRAASSRVPTIISTSPPKQGGAGAAGLMPPPPNPALAARKPGVTPGASAPRTGALKLPPATKVAPLGKKKRGQNFVALAPGFGLLDWAGFKARGEDLRVCCMPLSTPDADDAPENRAVRIDEDHACSNEGA
jgi:hypothetical protein